MPLDLSAPKVITFSVAVVIALIAANAARFLLP